jgi:hypothetical protein
MENEKTCNGKLNAFTSSTINTFGASEKTKTF